MWKKIKKDKDGFFDEESGLYEELPIIVAEVAEYEQPIMHYVDEEAWFDIVADLSRARYKYYMKCEPCPSDMQKYKIEYLTWGNMMAQTFVWAHSKGEAKNKFREGEHFINCQKFIGVEEV